MAFLVDYLGILLWLATPSLHEILKANPVSYTHLTLPTNLRVKMMVVTVHITKKKHNRTY